jgi:hypothetical protein
MEVIPRGTRYGEDRTTGPSEDRQRDNICTKVMDLKLFRKRQDIKYKIRDQRTMNKRRAEEKTSSAKMYSMQSFLVYIFRSLFCNESSEDTGFTIS